MLDEQNLENPALDDSQQEQPPRRIVEKKQEEQTAPVQEVPKFAYVPIPAGGLVALAKELYPDDKDNQEALDKHVQDLLVLNRDVVRTATDSRVGFQVRVPA